MSDLTRHLDFGSRLVVVVTFVLFAVALFVKGLGHGILLEAGVFLVSVKLILMTYKNGVTASDLSERLTRIETTLVDIDERLHNASTSDRLRGRADAVAVRPDHRVDAGAAEASSHGARPL
jgi:hypothetical protein